jgi:polar amino acid transport system substrate-binding protein
LIRPWLVLAAAFWLVLGSARADPLDAIHQRGELVVGVKADYPPFGMVGSDGHLVGLEPDLAADLARQLGVTLRLTAVTSANRLQLLREDLIDVLIATLGATPRRGALVTLVEPGYFASGVSVLAPAEARLADWVSLRGQTVCAVLGAFYNEPLTSRFGLRLATFNGTRDAGLALRQGNCVGLMYDDSALDGLLSSGQWSGYTLALPSLMQTAWAVALAPEAKGSRLERAVSDAVAGWHRSGLLVSLTAHWKLPPNSYLIEARARWTRTDAAGRAVCERGPGGDWPTACLDPPPSPEVAAIAPASGGTAEWPQGQERFRLLVALGQTLSLAAASVLGGLAIGIAGAVLLIARPPVLGAIVRFAANVARTTPPLLQIYFVAFGFGEIAAVHLGFRLNGFLVASVCLAVYAGAANCFAIEDAFLAARDHVAQPRGVASGAAFRPALLVSETARLASVPVMNISVNIVKATGMASAIAVPELVFTATTIIVERGNSSVMMNLLLATYVAIVLITGQLLEWAGSKLGAGWTSPKP